MAKILFIQDIGYEHLGAMYLAAVLKQHNHQCDVLIDNLDHNLIAKAKSYNPDLVGFSVITGSQLWCLDMAKKVKAALNCKIIFGGPHATYFPEIIKYEQVDFVCRGEGEAALLEVADAIEAKTDTCAIRNIWAKKDGLIIENDLRNLIEDLDALPFPDRSIYYKYPSIRNMPQKRFLATRGCPYNCSFCFNRVLKLIYRGKGRYIRSRSVGNFINEISQVKSNYPLKTIYFEDDTFILDHNWVFAFLKEYRQNIKLPFICLVRANLVNEDIVRAFRDSGCRAVFFGVETGNEVLRNEILKKDLTNSDIINTAALLHKYGIRFKTYNILGLPDETLANALETVDLNVKIKTDFPWCSIFQPYPGTELGEHTIKGGFLKEGFSHNDIMPYYSCSMLVNKKDIRRIINLQRFFVAGVKLPFLRALIKKLINLPANMFFDLIFILGHTYVYLSSEDVSIKNTFSSAMRSLKRWFPQKN